LPTTRKETNPPAPLAKNLPRLRPYAPGDFETLYAIDQVCYPRGIAYSRRQLRWFIGRPGTRCLVARLDDAMVGFVIAHSQVSRGHIITLDVLPEHRRRGLGRALVAEIEREFPARGVRLIELETATDNQPAIAFWQNCGYRIVGVIPRYYLDRIDAFYMTKALAPNPSPAAASPAPET
jgi:ribosomal-protein-alanine N-acetyltransferase